MSITQDDDKSMTGCSVIRKGPLMKISYLASMLMLSSPVQAVEVESCEAWSAKARTYAAWRLEGMSIAEAMQQTIGNRSRGLLLQAYQLQIPDDFQAQYEIISAFADGIYEQCQLAEQMGED